MGFPLSSPTRLHPSITIKTSVLDLLRGNEVKGRVGWGGVLDFSTRKLQMVAGVEVN